METHTCYWIRFQTCFLQLLVQWTQRPVTQNAPGNTVGTIPLDSAQPGELSLFLFYVMVIFLSCVPTEFSFHGSADSCRWRKSPARAPANTSPAPAACWSNLRHVLTPAALRTPPVCSALANVYTIIWVIALCVTTTCRWVSEKQELQQTQKSFVKTTIPFFPSFKPAVFTVEPKQTPLQQEKH